VATLFACACPASRFRGWAPARCNGLHRLRDAAAERAHDRRSLIGRARPRPSAEISSAHVVAIFHVRIYAVAALFFVLSVHAPAFRAFHRRVVSGRDDSAGDIAEDLFDVAEEPNEGAASCGRGLVGVIGLFVFLLGSVSAPRVLLGFRVILRRAVVGANWKFAMRWCFRFAWCSFGASCWSFASRGNERCVNGGCREDCPRHHAADVGRGHRLRGWRPGRGSGERVCPATAGRRVPGLCGGNIVEPT
jgi:hypothetical protein